MAAPVSSAVARPSRAAAAAGGAPRALLLANPRSSRAAGVDADRLAGVLAAGLTVTVARTEGRGHAAELARQAAEADVDVVVVAGGDGTVSEAAGGIAGSASALACLPAGCTNAFARCVGTPRDPWEAAERLAARASAGALRPRAVDLGTVNGRPFVGTSGVGFSASMNAVADAAPAQKARLGQLHFARAAARELLGRYRRRPPRMQVDTPGGRLEGVTVVVQNARALTYLGRREIRACPGAGLETGTLSLAVLRRACARDVPGLLAGLIAGDVTGHDEVDAVAAGAWAVVRSADGSPLPVEADGEYLGEHAAVEYGIRPGGLRIVA